MKALLIITLSLFSLNLYSQLYSTKDSLALLAIDAACDLSNNLNWNVESNPLNWEGVTWDTGTPKRVSKLEIEQKSLTGILDLTPLDSITLLNCNFNEIDALLLYNLKNISDIECSHNNLTYADISTLNNLLYFICSYNDIAVLAISDTNNYKLKYLNCFYNRLIELKLWALPNLTHLDITGGSFITLSFSENDSLIFLGCSGVGLQALYIENLASLEVLYCSDNNLTELDLRNQSKLIELECWGNSLTKLDLSATKSLWWLGCDDNNLTELDISGQEYLGMVSCASNQLTKLKMGKHSGFLQYFDCSENQLTEIYLSGVEQFGACIVKNNNLPFSSLITGYHAFSLTYSPQNTLNEPQSYENDTILDYSDEASIENTATEFVFFKDDDVIETNTTGLLTTTGSGVYHCEMTNALLPDLTLTTGPVTIGGTSVESLGVGKLSCYPNPASTNVILFNATAKPTIARIYDIYGQLISSFNMASGENTVDISDLPTGVYLITANGNAETIKLIKN